MSQILGANGNELTITIPSTGERDWATSIRDNCFQIISDHTHQGSGTGAKLVGYLSVDQTQALLANDTTLKSRNALGSGTVDVLKIDTNDELVLSASISSIELQDDGLTIVDNLDNTKVMAIDVSNVATATTRTLSMPDASGIATLIDATQTLTNKSIDSDNNTITNIANADIKTGAAISLSKLGAITADRAVATTAGGILSVATTTKDELNFVSGVTSAIQTQLDALPDTGTTNEIDLTGTAIGIADNAILPGTGSVTLPKGTSAQQSGSPQEGMFRFNTDTKQFEGYNDTAWGSIGGSGGGGLDTYYSEDFETLLVADLDGSGNNATYNNGGVLDGTIAISATSPISKTKSLLYTASTSSTSDWVSIGNQAITDKQRASIASNGLVAWIDATDFSVDFDLIVYDDTNSTVLETLTITAATALTKYAIQFTPLATTNNISFGIHINNAPVSTETIKIDDVELTNDLFKIVNLEEGVQAYKITQDGGSATNLTGELEFNLGTATIVTSGDTYISAEDDSGNTRTKFIATDNVTVNVSSSMKLNTANRQLGIFLNGTIYYNGGSGANLTNAFAAASIEIPMSAGEYLSFGSVNNAGTLDGTISNSGDISVILLARKTATSVITPAKNNATDWVDCTYDSLAWTGLGTVTSGLQCKRSGSDLKIRGNFTTGTTSASIAEIPLPNNFGTIQVTDDTETGDSFGIFFKNVNSTSNHAFNTIAVAGASYFNISQNIIINTSNPTTSVNGNASLASSTESVVSGELTIPIEGWTSYGQFLAAVPWLSTYSTSEQDTGRTWTDGKTIYRKAFNASYAAGATILSGVDKLINTGGITENSGTVHQPINYNDGTVYSETLLNPSTGVVTHNSNATYTLDIWLEYTKD